jgi:predicted RND superfamily exporter protein
MAGLAEQEREFLSDALTGLTLCLAGIYLTLAWVFSSWTRPVVVMAIIPFGLVGAIYGHHQWGVPFSMFSVVGLIGMVGIIINDSIVLVTTVDDYAQERGLIPAIIDGAADRLRPVLLTTLTTVLGLAPLLFETSQQAQFLLPTVITLVYGLGFGMVLVLLVVPALLAMQHDMGRQVSSVRRAMGAPARGGVASAATLASAGLTAAWFVPTLGFAVVTGAPAAVLAGLPGAADAGIWAGFALFAVGAAAISLAVWILAAVAAPLRAGRT